MKPQKVVMNYVTASKQKKKNVDLGKGIYFIMKFHFVLLYVLFQSNVIFLQSFNKNACV